MIVPILARLKSNGSSSTISVAVNLVVTSKCNLAIFNWEKKTKIFSTDKNKL